MDKILYVILVAVCIAGRGKGAPLDNNDDLVNAALARNWDELHRLLENSFRTRFQLMPLQQLQPISTGEVRDLKPLPEGRFYAESESTFHHAVNDNGKVDEKSGGHKVINDNGRVQEFDFKPQGPAYFHV